MPVTRDILEAMTQVIVDEVHPELVLLFGSQARGEAREESDVDLLVVLPEGTAAPQGKWKLAGQLYRVLAPFMFAKDILLYTHDESFVTRASAFSTGMKSRKHRWCWIESRCSRRP